VAQQIRSVPAGGTSPWDVAIADILTRAYDRNSSGWLDSADEVRAITCDEWNALDEGVRQSWDYGIRIIYGFEAGYSWVGDALKIKESQRSVGDARIVQCIGNGTATSQGAGDPAAQIRSFPDGGTSAWDAQVKSVIVSAFDTNGSGAVDTAAEIGAISCEVWQAMDDGVKQRFSHGLRAIYGFDPMGNWIGYAVGFSDKVRKEADAALVRCGRGD